jgi:DNA-binding NarL/FixJ family response regulator
MNAESISNMMKILESSQTGEEFDAMIRKNRTLHICKQKGFPILHKLGLLRDSPTLIDTEAEARRKVDESLQAQVVELLRKGYDLERIGNELNLTEYKMRRLVGMAGAEELLPDKRKQKAIFDIEDALRLAKEGLTTRQIGEHFNCTRQAISEKLRKAGYKYNKQRKEYEKC